MRTVDNISAIRSYIDAAMAPALLPQLPMAMDARQLSELQLEMESASSQGPSSPDLVRDDVAPVKSRPITRMLIVDEDPDIHRLLRPRLEARDYVVDFTSSSEDAIARLREFDPDVVLLDVAESGARGLDLLDLIRAQDLMRNVSTYRSASSRSRYTPHR